MELLAKHKVFFWRNNSTGLYDAGRQAFRKKGKYEIIGISDILGIFKNRFLAIEVKSLSGKLSANQKVFIDNVNNNGGIAFVARTVGDVTKELDLTE